MKWVFSSFLIACSDICSPNTLFSCGGSECRIDGSTGKRECKLYFFSFLTSLSVLSSLPSLYFIFLIFLTYKGIRGSTCIIVYEMFSVMEIFLFVNFLMGFCLNFFFICIYFSPWVLNLLFYFVS